MSEISFVGIKPEAQHYEKQIIARLVRGGLRVGKRTLVLITQDKFEPVWGKIRPFHPRVCRKVERQLLYRYVVVILFEGVAAVSKIVEIVGPKASAPRNQPHQLRYIYGDHHSRRLHANGIHRPKTRTEVLEHLSALGVDFHWCSINLILSPTPSESPPWKGGEEEVRIKLAKH